MKDRWKHLDEISANFEMGLYIALGSVGIELKKHTIKDFIILHTKKRWAK